MFKRLLPQKISLRLTLLYASIFSTVIIILNAGTLFGVRFFLIRQAKSQVQSSSRTTMNMITNSEGHVELSNPDLLSEANSNAEISINIFNLKGNIINTSSRFGIDNLNATSKLGVLQVLEFKDSHLVIKNDIINVQGKQIAYLQVIYVMHSEYVFITLLFMLLGITDFIGVVFSVLTGYLISKRILNPINRITKAAKLISIKDLKNRIDVGQGDDELSRLAITFNEMIERLQQSFEKQNRFVSDASHELRTPLAIIQGYTEIIDRWGKDDRNVLDESISAIVDETESMTSLIERLLFIARGDNERIKLQKEFFNLGSVIEKVSLESRLIAPSHNLNYRVDRAIMLDADKKLVKQMLRALIDNAIKFTPAGGSIEISAFVKQTQVSILVKDNGIGISEDDLPHIFDRFYRVDKARSKEKGGSGLGLSIVKYIAEAHQGTISIDSKLDIGTTVHIQLPIRNYI